MFQGVRATFLAGLLVVVPFAVTLWVIITIIGFVDAWIKPEWIAAGMAYYPDVLPQSNGRPPGLGVVAALVVVFTLGLGTRSYFGRAIIGFYERLLARVPVLSIISGAVKELLEMLVSRNDGAFQKVVMVEWPRKGLYSVGFQTGESFVTVEGEGRLVNVFLPTTPNPTTGFFFMLPADRVVFTDLTVEQGFKLLMSAGLVPPSEGIHVPQGQFASEEGANRDPGAAPVLFSAADAQELKAILARAKGHELNPSE